MSDSCLFYDTLTEQYFQSSIAAFTYAMLQINRQLVLDGWVCVNDVCELLGIPHVDGDELIGWDSPHHCEWIDAHTEKTNTDDGLEVFVVVYDTKPLNIYIRDFNTSYNERMVNGLCSTENSSIRVVR